MKTSSEEMVELIKQLIQNQLNELDQLVVCQVVECNKNGTYNVKVVPILDDSPIISNVKSNTYLNLKTNDFVYAMSIKNQLNNLIIFAKIGAELPKEYLDKGEIQSMINEALANYIPSLPDGQAASRKYVDISLTKLMDSTIPVVKSTDEMTIAQFKEKYTSARYFIYIAVSRVPTRLTYSLYLATFGSRIRPRPARYWLGAMSLTGDGAPSFYMTYSPTLESEIYINDLFEEENIQTWSSIELAPSLTPEGEEFSGYYVLHAYDDGDGKLGYQWVSLEQALDDLGR